MAKKKSLVRITFELEGDDKDQLPAKCTVGWTACLSTSPKYETGGGLEINLSGTGETLATLLNDISGAIEATS